MSNEGLKNKTISGVGWGAIDNFFGYGITFLVGLVLARLLSPSEYGLIGLTSIFITVLNSIIDSGFSQSLIRKKDVTNDDYNTMFITNMVLSLLMFVLLFFCAPFIASYFGRYELIKLSRVMGSILIINALSITQNTILTKRIDFKTKTKASLISALLGGAVGICLAIKGFGVWALVSQQLTKQMINTICLWFFNKWWPDFTFSWLSLKYMWGFGWKLLASSLLENIWKELYQMIVGKYYTAETLGQYSRSKEYAALLSTGISIIVGRATFPALATIQDDNKRLIEAYRKIIKLTMFVSAICLISMGAVAEPMVYCLIGSKWQQVATFMPLICISMSLYPLHAINLNMLKVQGRSDLFLFLEIIKKFFAIGPILLGIYVGIYWMLAGTVVTGFISIFLNSYYIGKLNGYTSWMQLKDIAPSYGIAFIVSFPIYFFKFIPFSYWITFPSQVLIGFLILLGICYTMKIEEYKYIKEILVMLVNKIHH